MADLSLDLHDTFNIGCVPTYDYGFKYDDSRLTYDSPAISDQIAKQADLTRSDSLSITDNLAKQIEQALSDQMGMDDAMVKEINLGRADTLSLADGEIKSIHAYKTETFSLADAIAKDISIPLSDALTIADTFSRQVEYYRSKSDTIGITDSQSKNVGLSRSESLSITDGGEVKNIGVIRLEAFGITDNGFTYYVPAEKAALFIDKESVGASPSQIIPRMKIFATSATSTGGQVVLYNSGLNYDTSGYYYDRWYDASGNLTQGEKPKMTVDDKNAKIKIGEDKANIVDVSK